jgi:hypothetical protein
MLQNISYSFAYFSPSCLSICVLLFLEEKLLKYSSRPQKKAVTDNRIIVRISHWLTNMILNSVKAGSAPATKARHVNPKENPGLPGSMLEIAVKVNGMVMLNENIPTIAI